MSVLVALALIVAFQTPAEVSSCWVEGRIGDYDNYEYTVTVCRVDGQLVEYAAETDVPVRLYPNVGTAAGTQCWFFTGTPTQWIMRARFPNGDALLGWDPNLNPGGPIVIDVRLPVCRAEPTPGTSVDIAWNLVADKVLTPPDPILDPPVPYGLAGLDTYVNLTPPDPFTIAATSPVTGVTVEARGRVTAVTVVWGDGTVTRTPPTAVPTHIYEVKTCDPPGGRRCHPTLDAYPLSITYDWEIEWRTGAGPWQPLPVTPTPWTTAYPVTEVIGILTSP